MRLKLNQSLPFIILMAVAICAIFVPSVASFNDGGKYNTSDIAWIIVATALVFLMTPGLAFFYGGMVHRKKCSFYDDEELCSHRGCKCFMGCGRL